jgi:RimJ/RimL family protein N-acetyltransferase
VWGNRILVTTDRNRLLLAPIERKHLTRFINESADWGMQSYEVVKYLGRNISAPSMKDEHEWWDKANAATDLLNWGIYVFERGQEKLVGNTSFSWQPDNAARCYVGGTLIFDRNYWSKGIASSANAATIAFVFNNLDGLSIRSAVLSPNIGSCKPHTNLGFVQVGTDYCISRRDGSTNHQYNFLMVNPSERSWNFFWGDAGVPQAFKNARKLTQRTLERAATTAKFE